VSITRTYRVACDHCGQQHPKPHRTRRGAARWMRAEGWRRYPNEDMCPACQSGMRGLLTTIAPGRPA
jgi:hypothetical protein